MKTKLWPVIRKNRLLIFIFFLGLLLRLVLCIQIYSGDVNNHVAWGKDALRFGFAGIYQRSFEKYGVMTPTYPPMPLFFFTFFYWLYQSLYQLAWKLNLSFALFPSNLIFFLEDQDTLPAFLKIPAILADLGIAWLIFLSVKKILKEKAANWPLLSACLVLFNPAFFYNSAYWGQIEAVPLVFILASFYSLFLLKRNILSALFLALAVLSKQTSIVFLPVFALGYLSRFNFKKSIAGAAFFGIVFSALFLPFFAKGNIFTFPFETYLVKIQSGSGSNYVTDHAFNFWALATGLGKIPDWKPFWLGLSYSQWSWTLFGATLLSILYILWKRKKDFNAYLYAAFLIPLSAFLFLTRMHERYLEQALPFLLLLSIKKRSYLGIFLLISFIHLINLYHNWWAPGSRVLKNILSQTPVINSMIVVEIGLFVYLCLQYYKEKKTKNEPA
ncbi:MAG TPA: hypothetical protein VMW25_02495 [Clostridia bacterium]|nr:hypothetical protein [Clostridia bacterium]